GFERADHEVAAGFGEGLGVFHAEDGERGAGGHAVAGHFLHGAGGHGGAARLEDDGIGAGIESGLGFAGVRNGGDERHRLRLIAVDGCETDARAFAALESANGLLQLAHETPSISERSARTTRPAWMTARMACCSVRTVRSSTGSRSSTSRS